MAESDIISKWSNARLVFFLALRNLQPPTGLTRQELIEYVKSKADVPITSVPITAYILQNLTRHQLISYLTERGYVPLSKAKVLPMASNALSDELEVKVLEFALKDYHENIATSENKHEYDYIIPKVLQADENVSLSLYSPLSGVNYDQFDIMYREKDLSYVLKKFSSDNSAMALKAEEKLAFVNQSLNFLAAGAA